MPDSTAARVVTITATVVGGSRSTAIASVTRAAPRMTLVHQDSPGTRSARVATVEPTGARLSLRRCRELLPPGFEIEDEELERVRDQFYTLAEAIIGCAEP